MNGSSGESGQGQSRLRTAFAEVTSLSGEAREALLLSIERDDPTLGAMLRRLVSRMQNDDGFMESPLLGSDGPGRLLNALRPERLPTHVGPYRLVEVIGEGAAGIVLRGEQDHPVCRTAAIKLLRPGLDSETFLRRFGLERQLLAQLRHPAIVQLLEAGVDENGRPWFAMEYVDGAPLLKFAAARGLDRDERLRLFADVCDAIVHAHARDVIHRDLSPANILATEIDGQFRAKVIDFGVGKALGEASLVTGAGELLGTLRYGSPEQLSGRAAEVDKRSDVFSLGAILYELLTGEPLRDLGDEGRAESLRRALSWTPPSPLERRPWLHGDLARVVAAAVEPDPAERTASVAALRSDLLAVLDGRPIAARRTTFGPAARLIRRHRRRAMGLAILALVLATTTTVAAMGWRRAVANEAMTASILDSMLQEAVALAEHPAMAPARRSFLELVVDATGRMDAQVRSLELRLKALDRLGDLEHERDDARRALELRREALEIARMLEAASPGEWRRRSALSTATVKCEDSLEVLDPAHNPLPVFREMLEYDRKTEQLHPDVPTVIDDLCWSLVRVASHLADQGFGNEAVDLCDECVAKANRLVQLEPESATRWWTVASCNQSAWQIKDGRVTGPRRDVNWSEAWRALGRVLELNPDDRRAIVLHASMVDQLDRGVAPVVASADVIQAEWATARDALARIDPQWHLVPLSVERLWHRWGFSAPSNDARETLFREVTDRVERLEAERERTPGDKSVRVSLAFALIELAELHLATGDSAEAARTYAAALDHIDTASAERPWNVYLRQRTALARLLGVRAGLGERRDLDEALSIMESCGHDHAAEPTSILELAVDVAARTGHEDAVARAKALLAQPSAAIVTR